MTLPALMDLKIVAHDRQYRGVPIEQLRKWAAEGRLTRRDLVRAVGVEQWTEIGDIPEIADSIPPATPQDRGRRAADSATPRSVAAVATHSSTRAPSPDSPAGRSSTDSPNEVAEDIDFDEIGSVAWSDDWPKEELEEPSMDMLPMIDVIFQLLIFFMFANQMANPSPIESPEAVYGMGVSPDGKQMILVDDSGNYFLGESTRPEFQIASVDRVIQQVAENAAATEEGVLPVIINAHKRAKHLPVRLLVEALSGMNEVESIKVGVEEKQ